MPHYSWYGINLHGVCERGTLYTNSLQELEQKLLQQEIALITSSVKMPWSRFNRPSLESIISFFDSLATLLETGVYLDKALPLLEERTAHAGFKYVINDIHTSLHNGASYKDVLTPYQPIFGTCALELIASGERIGQLPQGLRLTTEYYSNQAECAKKIKRIMMVPIITFAFFIIIAAIILGYIVPLFASLFLNAQKEIPWITQVVLRLSNWFSFRAITQLSIVTIPVLYVCKQQLKKDRIKKVKDRIMLTFPLYGRLRSTQTMYQFFQTTALLLAGAVHEIPALQSACAGLSNSYIQEKIAHALKKIQSGLPIADALNRDKVLIAPQVQAILAVGEESGTLTRAVEHTAQYYKAEIEKLLNLISTLVQPCLMIILGIFITLLIFAVYMPVLQLSYVIT